MVAVKVQQPVCVCLCHYLHTEAALNKLCHTLVRGEGRLGGGGAAALTDDVISGTMRLSVAGRVDDLLEGK